MKKPKTEAKPSQRFENMGHHFWVNDKVLSPAEIKKDMIKWLMF